jgi:hypothetical protein
MFFYFVLCFYSGVFVKTEAYGSIPNDGVKSRINGKL